MLQVSLAGKRGGWSARVAPHVVGQRRDAGPPGVAALRQEAVAGDDRLGRDRVIGGEARPVQFPVQDGRADGRLRGGDARGKGLRRGQQGVAGDAVPSCRVRGAVRSPESRRRQPGLSVVPAALGPGPVGCRTVLPIPRGACNRWTGPARRPRRSSTMSRSRRRSGSRPASTGGGVPGPGAKGLRGAADAIEGSLVTREPCGPPCQQPTRRAAQDARDGAPAAGEPGSLLKTSPRVGCPPTEAPHCASPPALAGQQHDLGPRPLPAIPPSTVPCCRKCGRPSRRPSRAASGRGS